MKIILADEDIDRRFAVKLLLRNYDCAVREARNFDILLSLMREQRPDICVINYLLSGGAGGNIYDISREITERFEVPVLVLLPDNISSEHEIERVRFLSAPDALPEESDELSEKIKELTGSCPPLKQSAAPAGLKTLRKILIADDEPAIRKLLSVLLKNYEIEEACDGTELEEKASIFHPDLIITDVIMPGLSGWKAVRAIREKPGFKDIPVIFASGYVKDKEIYEMHRPEGPTDFILKPFKKDSLFQAIKTFFVLD